MAERSSQRKTASSNVMSQNKKPSGKKTGRTKLCDSRPHASIKPDDNMTLLAKEEHYKRLNAKLEAKTADLVRQTEFLMKEQDKLLSKPLTSLQLTEFEDDDEARMLASLQDSSEKLHVKLKSKHQSTHSGTHPNDKTRTPKRSSAHDLATLEEEVDTFLSKTISNMEERMDKEHSVKAETLYTGDTDVPDAQIRVLNAKLRIMQEELDQITRDYYKKDDENIKLGAKVKELEEERARLQKSESILHTQMEKHKAVVEASAKKCEGLQSHVAELNKEIESLNRASKQAAALQNTVEIRLNRCTEESQRLKSELSKIKQSNKDKTDEEHQSKVTLLTENKNLRKQKAELIVGFKKQLKMIDILKRQKMHFEAAKLLSFTEEEFVRALDWGES